MLEIGRIVDRYTIEALIGEGGMAQVYRVRHTTLDVLYALKVLTLSGKELTARLVAEGKAQSKLQHPNILRVIDVIEVDGQPGLIMDFIDGPELGQWIAATKPDLDTAEAVFTDILAGVRAAHAAGLVHRDLKPANVLMHTGVDGRLVPKITDFGLVKAIAGQETGHKKTRSGLTMGTPAYMPPEQIRDASTVDERADIFALGCILFELVSHHPAYVGDDPIDIFQQVESGQRQALPATVPERVAHTIDECLAADRDRRPATSDAVLRSLSGSSTPRAITPRATSPSRATAPTRAKPAPLPPALVALGLTGVLGLSAVVGAAGLLFLVTRSETCTEAPTGWVHVDGGALPRDRGDWVARRPAPVRAGAPEQAGHGDVVCTLPTGSTAKMSEARDDGWVHLDATTVTIAPPGTPVPEGLPVCFGPAEGWVNVRSVFTKPKRGTTEWIAKSTQPLLDGHPTEANAYRTDWDELCEVPSGARVTIEGDIDKIEGAGWWIPVVEVR